MNNPNFTLEKAKEYFELEQKEKHRIYWAAAHDEMHILYKESDWDEIIFLSVHIDALGNKGNWKRKEMDYTCIQEIILNEKDFQAFYEFTQHHKISEEDSDNK